MKTIRILTLGFVAAALSCGVALPLATAQDLAKNAAVHEHETVDKIEKKVTEAMAKLSQEDRKLALAQRFCPMMPHSRLGSMGMPMKLSIEGKPVFVCCKGCTENAVKGGAKTIKLVAGLSKATTTLEALSKEERIAIEAQKFCAVNTGSLLGTMGAPIKLTIEGKPVYLCCDGCTAKANANPAATLAKSEELIHAGLKDEHGDHKH